MLTRSITQLCRQKPLFQSKKATISVQLGSKSFKKTFPILNTGVWDGVQVRGFANPNYWVPKKQSPASKPQYWTPQGKTQSIEQQEVRHQQNTQLAKNTEQEPLAYNQYEQEQPYQTDELLIDQLEKDAGYRDFMKKVSLTTATGLLTSGIAATAVITITPGLIGFPLLIGSSLAGLASLIGVNFTKPTYHNQPDGTVVAVDPPLRKILATTFFGLTGVSMAPLLAIASTVAPAAIPVAGVLTATTMGAMIAYGLKQPSGSLAKWGGPLMVGLFGLIGVGILSFFIKSTALFWISSIGGIGLFAAFTAFDLHMARKAYEAGQPDHLGTAVGFFINAANMFQDFLWILLRVFGNND